MKTLVMTILLASAVANAKTTSTQTLMPGAGQHEVTPEFAYQNSLLKLSDPTEITSNLFKPGAKYYFGLNENHAIGIEVAFVTGKTEGHGTNFSWTSKTEGMADPIFRYKGSYNISAATAYWGLGFSLSPVAKENDNLADYESEKNATTGQSAILLSAGIVVPVSQFKLGMLLDHKAAQEGKEKTISTSNEVRNFTLTGGSDLQIRAFVEIENIYHPNIAIVSWRTYSQNSVSGTSGYSQEGADRLGVELSARYALLPNFEIIPQAGYFEYQNLNGDTNVESTSQTVASLSGRWLF